ncbi:MAG: hypothetical protein E7Z99_04640 [Coriobacteriaceae bacterium]|jgi:hypothetical protein|nr:hypothetical protein [Coriobacteriaceae bacterium]
MLEQDYLVRMLVQFFQAMNRAAERAENKEHPDPQMAADMLETAVGEAVEMDGAALLALSPDSIAQVMRVTGIDPNITQFVARSMLLESVYLSEARQTALAAVRAAQARAIACEYGFDLPEDPADFAALSEGLEEAALAGGFEDAEPAFEEQLGELQSLQDELFGGTVAPAYDDEPYWMAGAEELEEDDSPKGFGAFIDDEDV